MAIQVLDRPTLAGGFAQSLGGGIGAGLNALAEHKLNEILKARQIDEQSKFWKGLGVPDDMARAISTQPPDVQKYLLDRLEGASLGGQQQEVSQPSANPIERAYSNDMQQPQQQPSYQDMFGSQEAVPSYRDFSGILSQMAPQQQQMSASPMMQQPQQNIASPMMQQGVQQVGATAPRGPIIGPSSQERRHREILEEKRLNRMSKEQRENWKDTEKFREEVRKNGDSGKEELFLTDALKDIEKTGNLNEQAMIGLLQSAGLNDVPGLKSSDTEYFEKVTANFVKGAKAAFGGNVAVREMDAFLKTVPNLMQSPEGRKKIYAVMDYFARAKVEKNKVMNQIIKEHNGNAPRDLATEVEDRFEPKQKQLTEKFNTELSRALELNEKQQASPGWKALLAHYGGKALKSIPGALLGAGTGALKGGLPGAAIGAGLGVLGSNLPNIHIGGGH